jgi:hypothetical protein
MRISVNQIHGFLDSDNFPVVQYPLEYYVYVKMFVVALATR